MSPRERRRDWVHTHTCSKFTIQYTNEKIQHYNLLKKSRNQPYFLFYKDTLVVLHSLYSVIFFLEILTSARAILAKINRRLLTIVNISI